jgi:hypothetical protein
MATLTTQVINRAGLGPTFAAATGGGDAMAVGSGMILHVKNTGGSPVTVTLVVPSSRTYEPNVAITSQTVSVPATTGDREIGPVTATSFADPVTGLCTITYSAVTGVTVAAKQLSQP